jgi:DNA-directed RNA polymerase specialized sigma24 family protein
MSLIIVPQDYDSLPRNLAPICIEDHDAAGLPINLEWIDRGVRPIHRRLCHLTERIVGDLWAVSEVAGNAVHGLWREYGDHIGSDPARQVQARAEWEAKDIRAGGWRLRKGRERYLDDLDDAIRAAISCDPRDYEQIYEMRLDMQALARTQDRILKRIIDLYLRGWTWQEIGAELELKPNTLERRFRRWTQRLRQTLREP